MERRTQSLMAMAIIGMSFGGVTAALAQTSPAAYHTIREIDPSVTVTLPRVIQSHAAFDVPLRIIVDTPPAVVSAPEMNAASAAGNVTLLLGVIAVLLGRRAKRSSTAAKTSMIAA